MKKIILIITLILSVFVMSACTSYTKGCTMEAKICSDGSAVGRTGPNCEFTPCPEVNISRNIGNPNEFSENSTLKQSFFGQYEKLKTNFTLKYSSYIEAVSAFRQLDTNKVIGVERISFYVPGKVPRTDGNPYFIGTGTISYPQNKCVYGYYNLVTGEGKVWEDVCYILG